MAGGLVVLVIIAVIVAMLLVLRKKLQAKQEVISMYSMLEKNLIIQMCRLFMVSATDICGDCVIYTDY